MSFNPYRKRPKPQRDPSTDAFTMLKVYIPKATAVILSDASESYKLPMSRLVAVALDNELDSPLPFNYPLTMPDSPYVPFAYVEESGLIMSFLKKFPAGTGRDTLMLCRRDIGIPDRQTFMQAYRELIKAEQIQEFTATGRNISYYGRSYIKVRAVDAMGSGKKFKRVEGEGAGKPIKDEDIG